MLDVTMYFSPSRMEHICTSNHIHTDMPEIPCTQTVAEIVNPGPNARMAIRHDAPVGIPGPGEVLLKLECTGVW